MLHRLLASRLRLTPRAAAVGQGGLLVALGAAAGRAASGRRGAGVVGGALVAAAAVPYAVVVARHAPYADDQAGRRHWLVDSTWSAPNTIAGAAFLLHQLARGNRGRPERSRGSGSIWLERQAIAGFATTIGVVKAGSNDRVDAHEDVHVLQARLLGPLYLPLVGLDYVLATVLPFWLLGRRDSPPIRSVRDYFLRGVYREVWHERWAYAASSPEAAGRAATTSRWSRRRWSAPATPATPRPTPPTIRQV